MRNPGRNRSFVTVVVCVLVLAVLPVGCASPPKRPDFAGKKNYEDVIRYLNTYIAKAMKKNKVTGLSIALVDDREIIFARGFGYADRENEVPATKNTVYRAGPVSTLFTAAAVMQLAQAGMVDIDTPFYEYVPGFSIKTRFADAGEITPRNLMTHHSGLPSDYTSGMFTRKPESTEQFLPRLNEEYTAFPPDLVFSYSNLGVGILGLLIENVSMKDYADYMNEEVFKPLGMNNSSFVRRYDFEALIAKGYVKKQEQEQYRLRDMPTGSLYSNVLDLSRFMQMIFAGGRAGDRQILKPGTLLAMLTVQNKDCMLDMDLKMGLGWKILEKEGVGTIIGQGGGIGSFFGKIAAIRKQKLAAIVLTNCAEGSVVADEVCMEALLSVYEAKTHTRVPEKKSIAAETALAQEELKRYEGHYDTAMGFVTVSAESNKLVWHAGDKIFILTPRQDGSFTVRYLLFGFIPIAAAPFDEQSIAFDDIAGYSIIAGIKENARRLMGTRIEPVAIPAAWHTRQGRYENAGHGQDGIYVKSIEISKRDGFLLAEVTFTHPEDETMTLALMPVNETDAIVMGLGRGSGYTYTFSGKDDFVMLHAYGNDLLPGQQAQE